ncbi:MAG: beta strand repeat-containing protein [Roseibacillus sp.]
MKKSISLLSLPISFRLALLAGLFPISIQAQLQWDTTTGDAVVTEGTGTWAVGVGNWWDGGADQVWADGNTAVFGGDMGTAATVTLAGDVAPSKLDFNVTAGGNYTLDLASHDLTFGTTDQYLRVNGGATATIDASSGGKLFLNGTNSNNSMTGTLTINAQVSESVAGSRFFAVGANTILFRNPLNDFTGPFGKQNGGGGLRFDSIADIGVPSAAGAGSEVRIGTNGQVRYDGSGHSTNRALSLVGGGNATFHSVGSGPIVWTGAASFSNTSSNNKILTLRGGNTGDNEIQGTTADNGANTLAITKADAGKWILSGDNTYTGKTTISAGTLQANAADVAATSGALGVDGIIEFNGGTLQYGPLGASSDYASRIIDSDNPMRIDTNGQSVSYATVIDGTNTGGLIKNGTGSLTLAGDNLYTGTTIINDGVLVADAADVLDGVDPTITLSGALGAHDPLLTTGNIDFGGGTLQYTANSAATDYSARIVNSGSPMIFDTNGQDVTLATDLANSNNGGLIKEGAGTLVAEFASGDYTGLSVVNEGTLQFLNDDASGNVWGSGNFEINNGSRLELVQAGATTVFINRTITFDTTGAGTLDVQGTTIFRGCTIVTTGGPKNFVTGNQLLMQNTHTINFDVADGSDAVDLEVSARIERGSVGKTGDGTVALTNVGNTLRVDNTVTITEGVLEVAGAGRLDAGNWDGPMVNDSIFRYNSTANQTMTGVISGTGALEKDNTSTLILTAANTYTGDTTVNGGVLDLGDGTNNTNLADNSTVTIASGASINLEYSGTDNIAALVINGVSQPDGVYDSTNAPGVITGPGTLTVTPVVATIYGTWASDNGLTAANNTTTADPDSDGLNNLLEFGFGTDPLVSDSADLVNDGSVNGLPILEFSGSGAGVTFDALFVRRDDHSTSGSLTYTVQFSADLVTFEDSTVTPTLVADSSDDSDYDVVSVPFPGLLPGSGQKPRFFRVKVELVP